MGFLSKIFGADLESEKRNKFMSGLFSSKEKEEDSIHLRAVRYGYQRPNGFSYKEIEHHYSRRPAEWEVAKAFMQDARKNKDMGTHLTTPFMMLKAIGSTEAGAKYTLSYEACFSYLGYLEFVMARRNARTAFWTAIVAIVISAVGALKVLY